MTQFLHVTRDIGFRGTATARQFIRELYAESRKSPGIIYHLTFYGKDRGTVALGIFANRSDANARDRGYLSMLIGDRGLFFPDDLSSYRMYLQSIGRRRAERAARV